MTTLARAPQADPLYQLPPADRPAYATGMLLDAQDFSDEQTYHRGRLARALMLIAGGGTLAGLRVAHQAAQAADPDNGEPERPEEIRVEPGLAVDRLGRLVEVTRPACLRLPRWWQATDIDLLQQSAHDAFGNLLSARAQSGAVLPARAVVADLYLRFIACPRGLTPAFASGPFDALNAVTTARVRDAYELSLLPRAGLDSDFSGLPLPAGSVSIPGETAPAAAAREAALGNPADAPAARRAALQDATLYGYPQTVGNSDGSSTLAPLTEHVVGTDTSAIFLARVLVPIAAGNPPQRAGTAVLVDNYSRRFLPGLALLARWGGY
jgi:hypothetical protein